MIEIGEMNNDGDVTNVKTIKQRDLIFDCWFIQVFGIEACNDCEVLDTDECGGQEIRKKLLENLEQNI